MALIRIMDKKNNNMRNLKDLEIWFITGSQHLYGPEILKTVEENALTIANSLSNDENIPLKILFKPIVKTTEEIFNLMLDANYSTQCVGIITWMHTFYQQKCG